MSDREDAMVHLEEARQRTELAAALLREPEGYQANYVIIDANDPAVIVDTIMTAGLGWEILHRLDRDGRFR